MNRRVLISLLVSAIAVTSFIYNCLDWIHPDSGEVYYWTLDTAINIASNLLLLVLGLLTLWRGRSWAAWGLSLFASAYLLNTESLYIAPPLAYLAQVLIILKFPLAYLGIYVAAESVARSGLLSRLRWLPRSVFLLGAGIWIVCLASNAVSTAIHGTTTPWFAIPIRSAHCIMTLASMLALGMAYVRAKALDHLRIRWFLLSTTILFVYWLLKFLIFDYFRDFYDGAWGYIDASTWVVILLGYTYAVLQQRLVDVSFVLDRTLVYGVTTSLVVGVLAAVNTLVQRATISAGTSLLLQVLVPLGLGIVLGTVRKRIDVLVERFFFRRKYRAEEALKTFARQCTFIEQPGRLLDQAIEQIASHSGASGVAFYEATEGGFLRVRERGDAGFPGQVDGDDLAIVALRATLREADLHTTLSELGKEGYAFPMVVRGSVIGLLVCGPRPGEIYTKDERELLLHVAHEVGIASHVLRARENMEFVDGIARGSIKAKDIKSLAKKLAISSS